MPQLEELVVPLKLNNSDFESGIERSITKASAFGSFMGNIAAQALTGIANVAGQAIDKVGDFLTTSVNQASTLSESINAVNVVFEDGAGIIKEFGKISAETVGLSNAKFNQLASVTGAFLTNLGFDTQKAADKTIDLTKRAADMASVFNTDVSQALEAIQSGLKGEFNPLEQFGVKLNAAAIEARAMQMGLADANGELSDSAKAQAALALVMEQTNKLAGDFTNTSDGLANSQRILSATFDDMKAKIGTALLPLIEELTKSFKELIDSEEFQKTVDTIVTKLTELSDWIVTNLPEWKEKFLDWGTSVTNTYNNHLKPVVDQLIRLYDNLNSIMEKLDPSTEKVAGKFTLLGIAQRIAVGWASAVNITLEITAGILNIISTVLERGAQKWDRFKNSIYGVIAALARLSIPWWLTPGSPTPLENGLRGIDNALASINDKALPNFKQELNINAASSNPSFDYNRLARMLATEVAKAVG
jgi:hypothetical protein